MKGTTFAHATIMVRRHVYSLNGYSECTIEKVGIDLWFKFFEKGFKGYNLQESLYLVRENKITYKRKNIKRRINEIKTMRELGQKTKLRSQV